MQCNNTAMVKCKSDELTEKRTNKNKHSAENLKLLHTYIYVQA